MSIDNFVAVENQDDGSSWEIHTSDTLPEPELCKAIAVVALTGANLDRAVLSYGRRGWKVPSAMVEPGDSPDESIGRQLAILSDYVVTDARLFGYRKMTHASELANYVAYYVARAEKSPAEHSASEGGAFRKTREFSDDEAQQLVRSGKMKRREYLVLSLGLRAAASLEP